MATFMWASSFVALKIALETMGPMSIVFGRMLVASLIFIMFLSCFKKLTFNRLDIIYIVAMVLLQPCLYFLFEIKALQFTSASQAGVITATLPLLTAIGAGLFLGEIITKRLVFGSILALLGAAWLSLEASVEAYAPSPLFGNFLEFMAMVCAAGYAIVVKHLTKRFSALFLTAIQAFTGTLFFLPLVVWESWGVFPNFTLEGVVAILYLGAVVTLGGYGLFNFALTKLPASKASAFTNLIPAFVVVLAFILLDERLNKEQLLATSLIFLGVVLTQIKIKKRTKI